MQKGGTLIILAGLLIIGLVIRLETFHLFYLYPDSYLYLIQADQIKSGHLPSIFFGKYGSFEEYAFFITRIIFPLLLALVSLTKASLEQSFMVVALTASVLLPLIAYQMAALLSKDKITPFISVLLIISSFSFVFWTGLSPQDMLAILFFWEGVYCAISGTKKLATIMAGLFITLALLTKTEYVVLLLLFIGYLLIEESFTRKKLLWVAAIPLVSLSLVTITLGGAQTITQIQSFSGQFPVIIMLALSLIIAWAATKVKMFNKFHLSHRRILLSVVALFLAASIVRNISLGNMIFSLPSSLLVLVRYDTLFAVSALAGLIILLKSKKPDNMPFFLVITLMVTVALYNIAVNPYNTRYILHYGFIMALLGGYAFDSLQKTKWFNYRKNKFFITTFFMSMVVIQTVHTMSLSSVWIDPENYEKVVALKAKEMIIKTHPKNPLVITYMTEPFYFFTKYQVFRPIEKELEKIPGKEQERFIVLDMATRDQLPEFSETVKEELKGQKIGEFYTGLPYRWNNTVNYNETPVEIYKLIKEDIKN